MKTDREILLESYSKYKDKNGKKAKNLKDRIDCFEAFENLCREVLNEGKKRPTQEGE